MRLQLTNRGQQRGRFRTHVRSGGGTDGWTANGSQTAATASPSPISTPPTASGPDDRNQRFVADGTYRGDSPNRWRRVDRRSSCARVHWDSGGGFPARRAATGLGRRCAFFGLRVDVGELPKITDRSRQRVAPDHVRGGQPNRRPGCHGTGTPSVDPRGVGQHDVMWLQRSGARTFTDDIEIDGVGAARHLPGHLVQPWFRNGRHTTRRRLRLSGTFGSVQLRPARFRPAAHGSSGVTFTRSHSMSTTARAGNTVTAVPGRPTPGAGASSRSGRQPGRHGDGGVTPIGVNRDTLGTWARGRVASSGGQQRSPGSSPQRYPVRLADFDAAGDNRASHRAPGNARITWAGSGQAARR